MSKYRFGYDTVKFHKIDPANGLALAGSEVDITDDILRDTFDFAEEDGTTTDIYSEMNNTPVISFSEPGKETISLGVMEVTVDTLKEFIGGDIVVGGGGERTWSKPANVANIERRLEIVTADGYQMIFPRVKVICKKNFQVRRNNIFVLDIECSVLLPEHAGLSPMDVIEPAP